jgi:hypothetical protein
MDIYDQVAAIAYYGDENSPNFLIQHLPTTDFKSLLFYSPLNNLSSIPPQPLLALQKFLPSK